ncbi:5'-Nucleotidase domain protein [Elusimicrobium minutum Pei191]|uniref:5'-Nucleotidase domain protein n=1 Tax=Elusimicrobium minutum (strain Pei191) TaxID=445932 RepID=B2KES6_ELUMP|nr:bifunctional UDP-sugar hydrolase/5'-nucleotidase [Elusimicrobium minutum]ACC99022.1 5'-Nucleotidase domain protein [Elusimicrobium minutum Pei191]
MKKISLLLAFALTACFVFSKQLIIYHTSDTHGFYYPERNTENNKMWGGFAAARNVVNKEKLPFLFLDSGDYCNGTVEAKNSKCVTSAELMNAMGYDATTIGNHEFDFGEDNFLKVLPLFKFPVLNSTITDSRLKGQLPYTKPYKIFERAGVKIAIIGVGKEGDNKHFKFANVISTVKKVVKEVKKENADIIILLIHDSAGDEKHPQKVSNKLIAEKIPEIDIVLGGHAHQEYQNIFVGNAILVESGCHLKKMSKIVVDIDDETNKYKTAKSELIPLYIEKTGQDEQIKELAESLRVPGMDVVLGNTAAYISKTPVKEGCKDSPINNWIADVIAKNVEGDFIVHNVGGARIGLEKGPVTMRDIVTLFPFDNKIAVVEVDGKFVKNFFINGIKNGRALYNFHGLTAKFKLKNNKVKNVEIFINGNPLQENKTYKLVTNEYIAKGKTEGWMFKKIEEDKKQFISLSIRDMLIADLKANSPLKPLNDECRLQVKN